jgi:hypothetical protein
MADEPTYQPDTPLTGFSQPHGATAQFAGPKDAAEADLLKEKLASSKKGMRVASTTCVGPIQTNG